MSDHQSSPSLGKRIGEVLILAIYLAVDVSEVWPKSHFWALVLAFAGVLALSLLDGGLSKGQIAGVNVVAASICVVIYFIVSQGSDHDRPLLSVTDVAFRNGPGPLNINWRIINGGIGKPVFLRQNRRLSW